MQGDVHGAVDPVPGDLVSGVIDGGHDRVRWLGSADQEPEPALIGEGDTSACPVVEVTSGEVQDGGSRLVGELADVAGFDPPRRVLLRFRGEVPGVVLAAAGDGLCEGRGP